MKRINDIPPLRLIFFNLMARGHSIRYLLLHSGTPFKDEIITRIPPREWFKLRDNSPECIPFKQLPVLEVGDKYIYIPQQRAILRYLGRELGYYPKENIYAARVDAFMDYLEDSFINSNHFILQQYILKKENLICDVDADVLNWKIFCSGLETELAGRKEFEREFIINGGDSSANMLTIADFMLIAYIRRFNMNKLFGHLYLNEQYPHLMEYYNDKAHQWTDIMKSAGEDYVA